jgi:Beta-lactamase enzyme family
MSTFNICKAILAFIFLTACSPGKKIIETTAASPVPASENPLIMPQKKEISFLEKQLNSENGPFANLFQYPDSFNLQIIYTQIDRDKDKKPRFTDHFYGSGSGSYFYPASTVKMPVAILALQKLRELNIPGLDANSTMITETGYSGQTPVYNDPSTSDGKPTIANYIKKIFLVSDNDAYNRLFEFLGPEYINAELQKRGYTEVEIIHRLETSLTEDQNRHTNPIRFLDAQGKLIYEQPGRENKKGYATRNDKLGRAYMRNGEKLNEPLDFSRKNRISLNSLHSILRSVMFPEFIPVNQRFGLTKDDYAFLRNYMSATPSSVGLPPYDAETYYDTYCKFLLFGADKDTKIPTGLKVYNKVGDAYGHLLDIAYFLDTEHNLEFMISVIIYCNKDGILNDDNYDYDELGFPFMKFLGQEIYKYELKRAGF